MLQQSMSGRNSECKICNKRFEQKCILNLKRSIQQTFVVSLFTLHYKELNVYKFLVI